MVFFWWNINFPVLRNFTIFFSGEIGHAWPAGYSVVIALCIQFKCTYHSIVLMGLCPAFRARLNWTVWKKTFPLLLREFAFNAVEKTHYLIFSCDQAALWMVFSVRLSVCPSVCLSVCPSVTPFLLCSHHRIIMKFSGVITLDQG